ncbi:MAG: hypothetical protein ACR2F6_17690 [Mycobacteriales bacterium]
MQPTDPILFRELHEERLAAAAASRLAAPHRSVRAARALDRARTAAGTALIRLGRRLAARSGGRLATSPDGRITL